MPNWSGYFARRRTEIFGTAQPEEWDRLTRRATLCAITGCGGRRTAWMVSRMVPPDLAPLVYPACGKHVAMIELSEAAAGDD